MDKIQVFKNILLTKNIQPMKRPSDFKKYSTYKN